MNCCISVRFFTLTMAPVEGRNVSNKCMTAILAVISAIKMKFVLHNSSQIGADWDVSNKTINAGLILKIWYI